MERAYSVDPRRACEAGVTISMDDCVLSLTSCSEELFDHGKTLHHIFRDICSPDYTRTLLFSVFPVISVSVTVNYFLCPQVYTYIIIIIIITCLSISVSPPAH